MQPENFQILKKEKPGDGMFRVMNAQIELACGLCSGQPLNAEESVHEIRKTIKRIRSVIRLLRFNLGEDIFREENNKFGSISLLLADLRRSAAHLEILHFVLTRSNPDIPKSVRHILFQYFKKKKASIYCSLSSDDNVLGFCRQRLSGAKDQLINYPLNKTTPKIMLAGLKQTYKSGCNRLKKAMQDPTMENNHAFRKVVKNLWNQLQVLRILWPSGLNPHIQSLDKLGYRLGIEHDLAELELAIKENNLITGRSLENVLKIIESQRKKHQRSSWKLAVKIYAETPRAFSDRMKVYNDLLWEG